MPPIRRSGSMRFWAINSRADFRRPCVRCSSGRGALGITTPRREVNKPAFYFRAVLLQPCQEFSRCFVRVLVDGMNFVASLKVIAIHSARRSSRQFMAAPVRSASWLGSEHSSGRAACLSPGRVYHSSAVSR